MQFGEQSQVERQEEILDRVNQLAARFRLHTEAVKAYRDGRAAISVKGARVALGYFERAVSLDPDFAIAYSFVSRMKASLGEMASARESASQAWRLRDHASDQDRFNIEHSYDRVVSRQPRKSPDRDCRIMGGKIIRATSSLEAFSREKFPSVWVSLKNPKKKPGRPSKSDRTMPMDITIWPIASSSAIALRKAEAILKRATDRHLDIYEFLGAASPDCLIARR